MGGNAFLIHGSLPADAVARHTPRPSLLGRLFGTARSHSEGGVREVPAGDLGKRLRTSFHQYLQNRIGEPWVATRMILAYLDMGHDTYVRANQPSEGQSPGWYVQLMFSGCSGMGEVSAELAVHWASIWFADQRVEVIRDHLVPFGFEANSETDEWVKNLRFLPLGEFGYAKILPASENAVTAPDFHRLEVDYALAETLSEAELAQFLADLESQYADEVNNGKCRCQLCSPEFDAVKVASLLERLTH